MKMYVRQILNTASVIIALHFFVSCQLLPNHGSKRSEVKVVEQNASTDSQNKQKASRGDIVKSCGIQAIPETFIGVATALSLATPLGYIGAIGFVAGEYYFCYVGERETEVKSIDVYSLSTDTKREIADDVRESFDQVRRSLEARSDDTTRSLEQVEARIKELGESEREAINRTANHVLRELYEQLDVIRNTEIKMIERENKRFVPDARSTLDRHGRND